MARSGSSMVGWGVCILPSAIFKHAFDVYSFSMISNLFDCDNLTPQPRISENVRTKCIIFGEALRVRVKKFKQNSPENYSKSTKMAITACTVSFQNLSRRSIPPDLPKAFSCFSISCTLVCSQKEYAWKNCGNYGPPLLSLRHLADVMTFCCSSLDIEWNIRHLRSADVRPSASNFFGMRRFVWT